MSLKYWIIGAMDGELVIWTGRHSRIWIRTGFLLDSTENPKSAIPFRGDGGFSLMAPRLERGGGPYPYSNTKMARRSINLLAHRFAGRVRNIMPVAVHHNKRKVFVVGVVRE